MTDAEKTTNLDEGRINRADAAAACLSLIARHDGIELSEARIAHELDLDGSPLSAEETASIAERYGFMAKVVEIDADDLLREPEIFPLIVFMTNGAPAILTGIREIDGEARFFLLDPLATHPGHVPLSRRELEERWGGVAIPMKRMRTERNEDAPFGLSWFLPEILRHRSSFAHVALAALALHALGFASPLFFQTVIDKVLVHQADATLRALAIGVVAALCFDACLSFLRGYLLLWSTNRIDARLSSRVFERLMRLPMNFFEKNSSGILVKHMQQIEGIREFMTGKLFLTALDATALIVFIPALLFYSLPMAGLVLSFSALVCLIVIAALPIFRRNLEALYRAEGERQSMLVETIHGMRTVKALALEPERARAWDDRTTTSIRRHFSVGKLRLVTGSLIAWLDKLSSVGIVFIGSLLVFDGKLTVGELVAIQMLAGRVSAPLAQLASLANEFQQASLSVRMLGRVMDAKPERPAGAAALRPELAGAISLENVSFHYPGSAAPSLDRVSLEIAPGSFVGVVGRSGSGKTTFTRLLQGLYLPNAGVIRFDGHDVREIDPAHLRRSIGTVVQESFLFKDTVRANVAAGRRGASMEEVAAAARKAGAEEFIAKLPQGYDTPLEENASNLSGGQKQRLAIARALLSEPPILVLDEATSALDPESEAIVHANLDKIAEGRTVLMVSHRLSSLVGADVILVFDDGRVVDKGTHEELLERDGTYARLWRQQIGMIDPSARVETREELAP
jgi:ATP-binding cassette subfamily B protein